jgi:outer membrane protein OmpA-like peptidoglycan-associated protein
VTRGLTASLLLALLPLACGPQRVATPEPRQDTFVLVADPGDGTIGRVTVTAGSESVELAADQQTTRTQPTGPPAPASVMDAAQVQQLFGEALTALPPAPQIFVLRFLFDSDELTEEARLLAGTVLRTVRERPVPDVLVVGHTDTTGDRASNFALGLKRATMVRTLLTQAGLDPAAIEVVSLGETDPQVRTPDATSEPLNRRVEIAVR